MSAPPLPAWPDLTERDRWAEALADVARRIEQDRGVVDPFWLAIGFEHLSVCYGDFQTTVAGPGPDVSGPEELLAEIDTWVAFERPGGPGRVLDRDLQAMADWRAWLAVQQPRYEAAAVRVFVDIEATTSIGLGWRVAVHETEVDWSTLRDHGRTGAGPVGVVGHVSGRAASWPVGPPTRPAAFPLVYLETRTSSGMGSEDVLSGADDLDDAVWDVAATVQDLVIEQVHGAWPVCPGHWHPMTTGPSAAGPVWRCPDDESVAVPIGRLVELRTSGHGADR